MTKKPKRLAIRPATGPKSDINITPLVDVVLVMLIIFMVVTPLLEKDIGVRIPATEQVEEIHDVPPDQLVVRVTAEGELRINSETVAAAEYVGKLTRFLAAKNAGDKLVFFMADEGANYGRLVAALDGAKQAGAETLGMATDLPEAHAPEPRP
jgi:biopolymer transport protein TolR